MDLILTGSLLAVAEHGSITDAASALSISQSALSRRIQQLEEHLGAQLLVRSQRGVVLTEMGRLVVNEGRILTARYAQLRERIQAHLALDMGHVRVGGGATAVSYLLPGPIAHFARSHPKVVFQLKEAGSREIEQDVLGERLELGVVTLPTHSPDLHATPLCADQIVLIGGNRHPLCESDYVQIADLADQDMVGFEAGSAIRLLIDGALRSAGIEMRVVMELRSIPAILQMVATTQSLAFVSERSLATRSRQVRHIPVRGLRISRNLGIIVKRNRPPSPAAAAFAQVLHAQTPQS